MLNDVQINERRINTSKPILKFLHSYPTIILLSVGVEIILLQKRMRNYIFMKNRCAKVLSKHNLQTAL